MYITGGNEEAARLSGIKVKKVRTLAYVAAGVFAAIGGIIYASKVGSGQIDAGSPLLMESVAAVFVGFSVFGAGKPNVIGTFIGSVLIGVLVNGLTMMNVQYFTHDIVKVEFSCLPWRLHLRLKPQPDLKLWAVCISMKFVRRLKCPWFQTTFCRK